MRDEKSPALCSKRTIVFWAREAVVDVCDSVGLHVVTKPRDMNGHHKDNLKGVLIPVQHLFLQPLDALAKVDRHHFVRIVGYDPPHTCSAISLPGPRFACSKKN